MLILAYFGPEVTLPMASVVATATGFVLAGWRLFGSWVAGKVRSVVRR